MTSEERKRVNNILTTPKECPETHIDTKEEKESPNSKQKPPIIDLFLNPARSKELEDMLKQSERRGASETRTKVNDNTFSLLIPGSTCSSVSQPVPLALEVNLALLPLQHLLTRVSSHAEGMLVAGGADRLL